MATVIPVDELISNEWYPGFKDDYGHAPWCVDPVRRFRKEDEKELATVVISDGDEVEVDGTTGRVTVLRGGGT